MKKIEVEENERQIVLNALGCDKKGVIEHMYNHAKDQKTVDACINYINSINNIMKKVR